MEASQLRGGYPGELPYQEACRIFHAMDPRGASSRQGPSVYAKFTGCCMDGLRVTQPPVYAVWQGRFGVLSSRRLRRVYDVFRRKGMSIP